MLKVESPSLAWQREITKALQPMTTAYVEGMSNVKKLPSFPSNAILILSPGSVPYVQVGDAQITLRQAVQAGWVTTEEPHEEMNEGTAGTIEHKTMTGDVRKFRSTGKAFPNGVTLEANTVDGKIHYSWVWPGDIRADTSMPDLIAGGYFEEVEEPEPIEGTLLSIERDPLEIRKVALRCTSSVWPSMVYRGATFDEQVISLKRLADEFVAWLES